MPTRTRAALQDEALTALQEKLASPKTFLEAGLCRMSQEELRSFIAEILDQPFSQKRGSALSALPPLTRISHK